MALQDQILSLSFNQGIETKVDLKQGVNGRLLSLNNAVFTGVTSLEKRFGYAPLPTTVLATSTLAATTLTTGNSLGIYNGALECLDGIFLYSFSDTEQAFVNNGLKIAVDVASQSLSPIVRTDFWPSLVYNGSNIKFLISPDTLANGFNTNYRASWFDTQNNVLLLSALFASGVTGPSSYQTLAFGTTFTVLTGGASQAQLLTFPQTLTPTATVRATYTSTLPPVMVESSTHLYVLYYNGTALVLDQYDTSFTLTNTATPSSTGGGTIEGLDLVYDSINNEILVGYVKGDPTLGAAVVVNRYNASTLAFIFSAYSANRISNITNNKLSVSTDGTNLAIFYTVNPNLSNANLYDSYITAAMSINYRVGGGTPIIIAKLAYGFTVYSKSFFLNGIFYAGLIYTGARPDVSGPLFPIANDAQNGIYTVGITPTTYTVPIRISYDNVFSYDFNGSRPAGTVQWSNNALPYFNAAQSIPFTAGSTIQTAEYDVYEADLTFVPKIRNTTLGRNLNFTGSSPSLFDGAGVAEQGYNTFPSLLTITPTNTGAISYAYTAVYIWTDFQGNLHRSAPAIAEVGVFGAFSDGSGQSVVVEVAGLGLSEPYKAASVQIQLYRTQMNGDIFFLVQTKSNSAFAAVSFTDIVPDSIIGGNEQLYTTGGEVENIPPPATRLVTEFKNREILVDAQNPLQWWFSKQVIQGSPVEFSDLLTQNIDEKGGPITAISTMDDKLVFFKTSNIWYVFGDGPAPNGQNNDFTYPQIVSSDTGCVNQDSIILTPSGLMFQSPKGIYMLDRGLNLTYIGSPVEAFNSDTVTSVQMIASTNQVRFTLNTGVALVYDYYVKQWSVFTNVSAVDSTIYEGNFTYLTASGVSSYETPNAYLDAGAVIPMSFTTGWMKLSDLQGFERMKKLLILGLSSGASVISSLFNYDYNSTQTESVSDIPVAANITRMQYRIFPPRQKGEAFQYSYSESPLTGSSGVTQVSNITLEIGIKKGPFKMPAANSFG